MVISFELVIVVRWRRLHDLLWHFHATNLATTQARPSCTTLPERDGWALRWPTCSSGAMPNAKFNSLLLSRLCLLLSCVRMSWRATFVSSGIKEGALPSKLRNQGGKVLQSAFERVVHELHATSRWAFKPKRCPEHRSWTLYRTPTC